MKALLSIQMAEKAEEISFQSAYEQQIMQQYPELNTFGLDNFSDVNMISFAQELAKRSEHILIVFESHHPDANPNKLVKLMNVLIKEKPSYAKLVLLGQHLMIQKMGKALGENFYAHPTDKELMKIAEGLFA